MTSDMLADYPDVFAERTSIRPPPHRARGARRPVRHRDGAGPSGLRLRQVWTGWLDFKFA